MIYNGVMMREERRAQNREEKRQETQMFQGRNVDWVSVACWAVVLPILVWVVVDWVSCGMCEL